MNNYYPVIYLIDDIITYIRSSINNSNGNSNIKVVRAVSFFVIFLVFLLLLFFLLFSCFFLLFSVVFVALSLPIYALSRCRRILYLHFHIKGFFCMRVGCYVPTSTCRYSLYSFLDDVCVHLFFCDISYKLSKTTIKIKVQVLLKSNSLEVEHSNEAYGIGSPLPIRLWGNR